MQTVKRNLKVDWTLPHREDVKAAVWAAVRRVLRRRNIRAEDFEPFLGSIPVQAEALYVDWPLGEYMGMEGEVKMTSLREARLRHAKYYEEILQNANELSSQGGEELRQGLRLFDREWENIRAGQAYVASQPNDEVSSALLIAYPQVGDYLLELRQNPRERIRWAEDALAVAKKDTEKAQVEARRIVFAAREKEIIHILSLGNAHYALGEYDSAKTFQEQGQQAAQEIGAFRWQGRALNNLGNIYLALGNYKLAIEHLRGALDVADSLKTERDRSDYLGNLGSAYFNNGQFEEAIQNYQQALQISQQLKDSRAEARHRSSLGAAWTELEQFEKARGYLDEALAISRDLNDRREEATHLGNLGQVYSRMRDYESAINCYDKALVLSREISDRRNEGRQLSNLGEVFFSTKKYRESISCYEQAASIFEQMGITFLLEQVSRSLAKARTAQRYSS